MVDSAYYVHTAKSILNEFSLFPWETNEKYAKASFYFRCAGDQFLREGSVSQQRNTSLLRDTPFQSAITEYAKAVHYAVGAEEKGYTSARCARKLLTYGHSKEAIEFFGFAKYYYNESNQKWSICDIDGEIGDYFLKNKDWGNAIGFFKKQFYFNLSTEHTELTTKYYYCHNMLEKILLCSLCYLSISEWKKLYDDLTEECKWLIHKIGVTHNTNFMYSPLRFIKKLGDCCETKNSHEIQHTIGEIRKKNGTRIKTEEIMFEEIIKRFSEQDILNEDILNRDIPVEQIRIPEIE